MKKRKTILAAALVACTALMSSCCGCRASKSNNPYTLESDSWVAIEVDSKKISSEEEGAFTITFDGNEGQILGKGECNRFFGSYTATQDKKLTFSNVGATKMMCPNQEQEDRFFNTLNTIDSYTIDGDMLMLLSSGEVEIILQATPNTDNN